MPGPATVSKNISGFDPRSVPGCTLWLDAADSSSVTGSSPVTAWRDKSGNANNTTTIGGSPSYSANFISLNGSTTYLVGPYVNNTQTMTMFVIATANFSLGNYGSYYRLLSVGSTAANDYNNAAYASILHNPNTTQIGGYRNSVTNFGSVTTNTVFLIALVYDGTNTINYINGTSVSSAASTGTFSTSSYSIGRDVGNTDGGGSYTYWPGTVGEVIIYNAALTSSQRQAIEGYLAWKWGIETVSTKNLVAGHPFYYNRVFSRGFQPVDIPGCMIWLDGADTTTMTPSTPSSGTSITAWRDKAGLMYSSGTTPYSFTPGAIQTASSYGTVYTEVGPTYVTGGGLLFSNSTGLLGNGQQGLGIFSSALNSSPLFTMPTQAMTIVIASLPVTNTSYRRLALLGSYQLGAAYLPNFILGPEMGASEGGSLLYDNNGSAWAQANSGTSGYNSNAVLRVDVMISSPGASQWWWTNGTLNTFTTSNVYTGTYSNYPVNYFFLASYTTTIDGNRNFYGTIYEVLLYNTAITTVQRQQIEGYLAWKWGFRTSLIAGHPYRTIPPSSALPFTPTSILGCQLWMDAAQDTSANNATITTIPDRSGNGITLTAIGTITFYQNYKNGNPVYYFGNSRASNASFPWGTSFTHIVVASSVGGTWLNSVGTLTTYVGLGNWALTNINSTTNFEDPGAVNSSANWTLTNGATVSVSNLVLSLSLTTTSGSKGQTIYTVPISSSRQTSISFYLPASCGTNVQFGWTNGTTTLTFSINLSGSAPASITCPGTSGTGNVTFTTTNNSTYLVIINIYNTTYTITAASYPLGVYTPVSLSPTWTNSGASAYSFFFTTSASSSLATTFTNVQFDPGQGCSVLPRSAGLANSWHILSAGYKAGSTTMTNYAINGSNLSSWASAAYSGTTPLLPLYIGGSSGGAYDTNTFAEIIHYNVALTTPQRQQVEGYLAAKWGISLLSTHPYYRIPPIQQYTNSSITTNGLILNLDPRSYVASASTWVPYVGNTWNVVNSPTVSQLNGYNILTFNGTNQYCYDPTGVNFQSAFSINIWINLAAVSTAGNVLAETNGGYQWTDLYVTGSTLYIGSYTISNVSLGAPVQGAWYNICITNSASGSSSLISYINGVYYSTTSYTRSPPPSSGNSFFYLTSSSGNPNYGYKALSLGVMCFYTLALSYQDVKQNYNALCWRYGLSSVNS